jgi:hypothetical protein
VVARTAMLPRRARTGTASLYRASGFRARSAGLGRQCHFRRFGFHRSSIRRRRARPSSRESKACVSICSPRRGRPGTPSRGPSRPATSVSAHSRARGDSTGCVGARHGGGRTPPRPRSAPRRAPHPRAPAGRGEARRALRHDKTLGRPGSLAMDSARPLAPRPRPASLTCGRGMRDGYSALASTMLGATPASWALGVGAGGGGGGGGASFGRGASTIGSLPSTSVTSASFASVFGSTS